MARRARLGTIVSTFAGALVCAAPAPAVGIVSSFDSGSSNLISIAYRSTSPEIFTYSENVSVITRYTAAGVASGTIPIPAADGSNELDLDFLPAATTIAGTAVPAGSLLVFDGDDDSGAVGVWAISPDTGAVLASSGTWLDERVGASYSPSDGKLYAVRYQPSVVDVVNKDTLVQENSFTFDPGSTGFALNYGDVDVDSGGRLFVGGSPQDTIRVLTNAGAFVQDIPVDSPPPGFSIAGLALDDATGEFWVGSLDGFVYRLAAPTAVTLSAFHARRLRSGVELSWRSSWLADLLGYRLVRSDGRRVNAGLLPASGLASRIVDRSAKRGRAYGYTLEGVRLDGSRVVLGSASVSS